MSAHLKECRLDAAAPESCAAPHEHKEADGSTTVHHTKPPQPPLMTMGEARVQVARMMNSILTKSSAEVTAALEQDPNKDSNAYQNGVRMVLASQEFVKGNEILIKRLTTPRILRPERSRRAFRG